MFLFLRSTLFNLLFFGFTALLMIVCLPILLGPPRWTRLATRGWAYTILFFLRTVVGLRYRIRGVENWPAGTGLIASNHQSAWDTVAFLALFPHASYILKKELLRIPFLGWYLSRLRMIAIDRSGGGGALQRLLRDAKDDGQTRQIIIFPEGTRVRPGEQRPYQSGIAALYARLGLPVTPMALNSGLFWPRRAFIKRPGTIEVEVMPPLPPGMDKRAFLQELRGRIEAARTRLETKSL